MAEAYLARRAASTEQLRRYLLRKCERRNHETGVSPADAAAWDAAIQDTLSRLGRAGLLDDAGLALSRRSGLIAKGLPARRVTRLLQHQGLDASAMLAVPIEEVVEDETQARRYAERKRLGPFASGRRAPSPERDIRVLVRAGFAPDLAARVLRDLMHEPAAAVHDTDLVPDERPLKREVRKRSTLAG